MKSRDAVINQLLNLLDCEIASLLELPCWIVLFGELLDKLVRQLGATHGCQSLDLAKIRHGKNSRNDRSRDFKFFALPYKIEIIIVVVEKLRDHNIRASIHFSFQVDEVEFWARTFLMRLRLACDCDTKVKRAVSNEGD